MTVHRPPPGGHGAPYTIPPGHEHRIIEVEARFVAAIIGKGGKNIHMIKDMSGAEIIVDEFQRGPAKLQNINIYGTQESIRLAEVEIQRFLNVEATEIVSVEARFVAAIIGKEGKSIQRIKEQTGCQIIVDERQEGPEAIQKVIIQGSAEGVKRAVEIVNQHLTVECSEEIEIESRFIPPIMGKAGANIQNIKKVSGAHIVINEERIQRGDIKVQRVVVQGTKEAVALALEEIYGIIQQDSRTLYVKGVYIPAIIGNKGQKIDYLRKISGAYIDVDSQYTGPEKVHTVTVSGTDEACDIAVKEIDIIMKGLDGIWEREKGSRKSERGSSRRRRGEYRRRRDEDRRERAAKEEKDSRLQDDTLSDGAEVYEMTLLKHHVPHIIGKRGSRINEVRAISKADVKIFDGASPGEPHTLKITGSPEQIDKAIDELEKIIEEASQKETIELDDREEVERIIGKDGDNIEAVRKKSNAHIKVEEVDNGRFVIDIAGTAAAIEIAVRDIQHLRSGGKISARRKSARGRSRDRDRGSKRGPRGRGRDRGTEDLFKRNVDVNVRYISGLIGRGGRHVQWLQDMSGGTQIQIEKEAFLDLNHEKVRTVTITGSRDGVETVIREIHKYIEEEKEEQRRDGRPPPRRGPPPPPRSRYPPTRRAPPPRREYSRDRDRSSPRYERRREPMETLVMKYDPLHVSHIIGTQGRQLAKIRSDSGASIDVETQKRDGSQQKVTVRGTSAQIKIAERLIEGSIPNRDRRPPLRHRHERIKQEYGSASPPMEPPIQNEIDYFPTESGNMFSL